MDGGQQDGRDAAARLGEEEVQRSSEVFINDLDAIRVLELEKRGLASDDPRRPELAARIEVMTMDLFARSEYQTRLVAVQSGVPTPPARALHDVLADWRDAERRLVAARHTVRDTAGESNGFRDEYQRHPHVAGSDT